AQVPQAGAGSGASRQGGAPGAEGSSFFGSGAREPVAGGLPRGESRRGAVGGALGEAFARRAALTGSPAADTRSGDVLADLQRHIREQFEGPGQGGGNDGAHSGDGNSAGTLGADQLAAMFSAWRESRDREQLLSELANRGLEGALESILATHDRGPESLCTVDRGLLRVIGRTFSRLTDRVRQQHETNLLLDLELPAAWLTLKDPLFLERQSHPGRRLINELCRVASTMADEESRNDPLRGKVDEIVERLNGFDVTLRQLSQLLTDLIDAIEKDRRTTGLREERVLQEADSQARLAQAHGYVAQILTDRLVGRRWPGFLVPFCEKAWSRVLFLTLLRQASPDSHGALSEAWRRVQGLLDRLLVLASARRPVADVERIELVAAVGAELEHIGYDPGESRRYLDSLDGFLAGLAAGAGRDDDIFVDAIAVDLPGQPPPGDDVPQDLDSETLAFVDALRRGAWVEFREEGRAVRCKLAGTVRASSRLIFTNRRGVKVAEEHRHRMAVKMQEGKVIVLDNSHLFDQAYNEVIDEVQSELRSRASRAG
ncbi:MAG: DUF1631 domain-containing protein, partial [Bacteroidales bacterium]|nr:DUF1631 domain-containing protein [Bacteroidales bacterium]